ncbi:Casein kinase I 1 [Venturia nashicola]|nr:Casein kinase I 1 [Venturia nashicola]
MRPAWEPSPLLWFLNKLSWISVLALLWSTSAYVHLDLSSYTTDSPCLFSDAEEYQFVRSMDPPDNGDTDHQQSLLDPSDGMPFTEIDGQLRKLSKILHPLPKFHISRPDREQSSSYGVNPITDGNETFITSVFDISCNGTISIRLPDLLQYNFIYHPPTGGILGCPNGNENILQRRASNALHSFVKRTKQSIKRDVPDSWSPFHFLVGPLKVSDRDQIGYQPRCPMKPFGLESFVKTGARPASFNGCGAENGMKIPDLRFTECCDNHDLCYDDCTKTWNQCNNDFRKCMHSKCKNDPSWTEWGCNNIADVYADFVSTRLGAWSFRNSNLDRYCKERCNFVDCTNTEPISGKLPKATAKDPKNSTTTPKTVTVLGTGSLTPVSTTNGSSTIPSTTTPTSKDPSNTSSTQSSSSTAPSSGPPELDCSESDSDSWWSFKFWSNAQCADGKATSKAPREKPNPKSSWWPLNAWFTTTNSPPKNETVAVSSVLRTETTIWWWPFFLGDD